MSTRGGELVRGKDQEPYLSPDPWQGLATPVREKHGYPEKPTSAPDPRHLSTDIQTQAQSFPGQRPGRVSTQVSMSYHTENPGRCKYFHCRSTRSHLNIISVDWTWRGLNLPCRQNLVRFKVAQGCAPRRHRSPCQTLGDCPSRGLSWLDRGLTRTWELGCTLLEEKIIPGLHISPTSGTERTFAIKRFNRQNKTGANFCGPLMAQILGRYSQSAAQCLIKTDRKWPDSGILGLQQEVDTGSLLEKLLFIRVKIYS